MEKAKLISNFDIIKLCFSKSYAAGHNLRYYSPCIGYIKKGNCNFLYNGRIIQANEGDLIYISQGTTYYSVWSGTPEIEWYSVNFSYFSEFAFSEYRFQILKNYNSELFDKMYRFKDSNPLLAVGLLYQILDDIYSKLESTEFHQKNAVTPAIEYIEAHYTEKFSIDELAKMCNMSISNFFGRFKSLMGISPISYKHNIASEHAIDLLIRTDKSIDEISEMLGFSSSNYFRKVFFKKTGKTPKDVRRTAQNPSKQSHTNI